MWLRCDDVDQKELITALKERVLPELCLEEFRLTNWICAKSGSRSVELILETAARNEQIFISPQRDEDRLILFGARDAVQNVILYLKEEIMLDITDITVKSGGVFYCRICKMETDDSIPLFNCRHTFCKGCLASYVAERMERTTPPIKCPETGCNESLLLRDLQVCLSYPGFLHVVKTAIDAFVLRNSSVCYCEMPECEGVIRIGLGKVPYCFACHTRYCTNCQLVEHPNKNCIEAENERFAMEVSGLELDLKICNKCNRRIERNGGCMLVECLCKEQSFCFYPKCNRSFSERIQANHHIRKEHPDAWW
eukprot:TRINITY_DN1148_c0_g1_i2.p1 TRINITY_DN1148_c0_g1~~TRINITY_DN1148_c0_g1_i2.p1  ORF type:complete len:309 (-),score=29.18 TRINITY_DN1148_c0_g1_i2:121-1047(-)